MNDFKIYNFQTEAKKSIYSFLTNPKERTHLFTSPTGSGKTTVVCRTLSEEFEHFEGKSYPLYIWVSRSVLTVQSLKDFEDKIKGLPFYDLILANDFTGFDLGEKSMLFLPWERVRQKDKNTLMRNSGGDRSPGFERWLESARDRGREIRLIVDEAHLDANAKASSSIVDIIEPAKILYVTATPTAAVLSLLDSTSKSTIVTKEEVIDEGLIRSSRKLESAGFVECVEKAFNKRKELVEGYRLEALEDPNITKVSPLVLIQVRNTEEGDQDILQVEKRLRELGVDLDTEVAYNLSPGNITGANRDSKKNYDKDEIKKFDSPVSFLFFKMAIGTGWDCPRAQILLAIRPIRNPSFQEQVLGRLSRQNFGKKLMNEALNKSYIFTDEISNVDIFSGSEIEVFSNLKRSENNSFTELPYQWIRSNKVPIKTKKLDGAFLNHVKNIINNSKTTNGVTTFEFLNSSINKNKYVMDWSLLENSAEHVTGELENGEIINQTSTARIRDPRNWERNRSKILLDVSLDFGGGFSKLVIYEALLNLASVGVVIPEINPITKAVELKDLKKENEIKLVELITSGWHDSSESVSKGIKRLFYHIIEDFTGTSLESRKIELIGESFKLKTPLSINFAIDDNRKADKDLAAKKEVIDDIGNYAYESLFRGQLEDKGPELPFVKNWLSKNKEINSWYKNKDKGFDSFSIIYYENSISKNFFIDFLGEVLGGKGYFMLDTKGASHKTDSEVNTGSATDTICKARALYDYSVAQEKLGRPPLFSGIVIEKRKKFLYHCGRNYNGTEDASPGVNGWESLDLAFVNFINRIK